MQKIAITHTSSLQQSVQPIALNYSSFSASPPSHAHLATHVRCPQLACPSPLPIQQLACPPKPSSSPYLCFLSSCQTSHAPGACAPADRLSLESPNSLCSIPIRLSPPCQFVVIGCSCFAILPSLLQSLGPCFYTTDLSHVSTIVVDTKRLVKPKYFWLLSKSITITNPLKHAHVPHNLFAYTPFRVCQAKIEVSGRQFLTICQVTRSSNKVTEIFCSALAKNQGKVRKSKNGTCALLHRYLFAKCAWKSANAHTFVDFKQRARPTGDCWRDVFEFRT